jgi:protein MpaA
MSAPDPIHVRALAEKNGWRPVPFGTSVEGIPLLAWWPTGTPTRVVWAAIHGEESTTMQLAHQLLRTVHADDACAVVVPVLNPDGVLHGTRQNANGVDLNRNFPAASWKPDPSPTFWPTTMTRTDEFRTQLSSPGSAPASEPEVQAIMSLIERVNPQAVIDIHAPLDCIIAHTPQGLALAHYVGETIDLPVVTQLDNPTPGDSVAWLDEAFPECASFTYEVESDILPRLWFRHKTALARTICEPGVAPALQG